MLSLVSSFCSSRSPHRSAPLKSMGVQLISVYALNPTSYLRESACYRKSHWFLLFFSHARAFFETPDMTLIRDMKKTKQNSEWNDFSYIFKTLHINKSAFSAGRIRHQKFLSRFTSLFKNPPFPRGSDLQDPWELRANSTILSGAHSAPCFLLPSLLTLLFPFPSPPPPIRLSSSAWDSLSCPSSPVILSFQPLICPHAAFCGAGH